jgi:hypothetical protein
MTTSKRIKQGNISPLWRVGVQEYTVDGVPISGQLVTLDSNYTCTVACTTAVPPLERAVTTKSTDNTRFLVQLTPTETLTMGIGQHIIAVEVENVTLTPPFRVEDHVELIIEKEYIVA